MTIEPVAELKCIKHTGNRYYRYQFYAFGFTELVYDYCLSINNIKASYNKVKFQIKDLGEVEDYLAVLSNQTESTISYKTLIRFGNGLVDYGSLRTMFDLPEVNNQYPSILPKTEFADVLILTSSLTAIRKNLIVEIESKLGLSMTAIDLIISSLAK